MYRSAKKASMWQPFGLSIGVHLLFVLLVVLGTLEWKPFKQSKPVGLTIEAVIVDTTQMAQRLAASQEAAEEAQQRQQLEERRAEQLEEQKQREREQEVQRQKQADTEKQKQVEAEKQKQLEVEKQRQKQLDDDARRKKEAQDKLAKMREDQERLREQERVKQQQELDKIRQQQEAAEKQRKLEAERLKQLEAREKAEQQAKALQEDQLAMEAAKQRDAMTAANGRKAELGDKYQILIQQIVTDNWLRPPTARPGLRCVLKIVQIPGGEVISAAISGACNGDEATRRSIVAAVERLDSLPYRGFEDVFAREIDFEFKYDGE